MGEQLDFADVCQEIRGKLYAGRLRLTHAHVVFKNTKSGKTEQLNRPEIEQSFWLVRACGYCLKIILRNGHVYRYDGFKESDFGKVRDFVMEHYGVDTKVQNVSVKGKNWGIANFLGNSMSFEVDSGQAFELPLQHVSHCVTNKNEVALQFHVNDESDVSLMEMRFYVPTDLDGQRDAVEDFQQKILNNADIIQATGAAVATFNEVSFLTPRGKYDLIMYQTFIHIHGKTFDYRIAYTDILRMFLLENKDGRQLFLVIALDPPVKQGQTRYHFLNILYNKDDETTVELGLTDEELRTKYDNGRLEKEMTGSEYEIVSRLFKALSKAKIIVPGTFRSHSGLPSITCSHKAAAGLLYPLEKGFIYVHKPTLHVRFDEIDCVNFARSVGSNKSFDLDIETPHTTYTFNGIDKEEYNKLFDFIKLKGLNIKNLGQQRANLGDQVLSSESEEEQADANADASKKVRRGGTSSRPSAVVNGDAGGGRGSSDEDEDADYDPDNASGGSVTEEYVSDPSSSTSDSESDADYSGGGGGGGGAGASDASSDEDEAASASGSDSDNAKPKAKKRRKVAKTVRDYDQLSPVKDEAAAAKKSAKKQQPKAAKEKAAPAKEKGKRAKKDKNAPKRPQSAYFLWLNENRERIKRQNPGIKVTEIGKKAGEEWNKLTDKTKWEQLAKQARDDYEKAMTDYRRSQQGLPVKGRSPKKGRLEASGDFKSTEFVGDTSSSEDESDDAVHQVNDRPDSDDDRPLKVKSSTTVSNAPANRRPPAVSHAGEDGSSSEGSGNEEAPSNDESDGPSDSD